VIRLVAQLGLAQQRLRSIEFIHHNLDELYTGRACKRRIFQQRIKFAFRAHSVRLGFWRQVLGSQDVEKLCPFPKPALAFFQGRLKGHEYVPVNDVIIMTLLAVQVSLDRVSLVIQHEQDRCESMPHGRR
jgi:hypothetical protein